MLEQVIQNNHQEIADFSNMLIPIFQSVSTTSEELKYFCTPETKESIHELHNKSENIFVERGLSGEIVALVALRKKDEKVVYLSHFYIHPSLQRKGFGTSLICEVEHYCKTKGYEYLELETQKKWLWAVNFYLKNDYIVLTNETLQNTYLSRIHANVGVGEVPYIVFYKKLQ